MKEPFPKRLIDPTILTQMIRNNPIIDNRIPSSTSLINNTVNPIEQIKIDKKLEKIKNSVIQEMGPTLLNGLLFVGVSLLLYYILQYRYNKKKNSQIK